MINIRRRVTGHWSSSRPGRVAVTSATTALLLAASLVACGDGSGDGNDGDSGTVTLTWYATAIDQNQFDYRQLLINEFQDAYPTIKIDLVSPQVDNTDAIRDELREMLPGDAAPDVYLGDVIWPAEFAEAGLARPLDDDFDAAFWDRFPPELSSPMRYQDKTYAVPFFATQAILYYRTDLMPAAPTTWEGLVDTANSLVQDGSVEYGFAWQGAAYEGLTCNWLEYLTDAGGRIVNEESTEALLDTPAAHRALQFMADLTDTVSHPQVNQFEEFDAAEVFSANQAAFLRGWNTSYTRMDVPDNRVYGHIGVAPLPKFADQPGGGYSTIGGWSLYVNPNTSHLDAAKTFIDWLTDDQAQLIIAGYSHLPVNAEVRAQLAGGEGNPAVMAGLQAQPVARPANRPDYPEISRIVYTAVNDALDHDPPADVALRRADDQLDELLR